jgi:hypothetical protein
MVVVASQQSHFWHLPSPRSTTEAEEKTADMMKTRTIEKRMLLVYLRLGIEL